MFFNGEKKKKKKKKKTCLRSDRKLFESVGLLVRLYEFGMRKAKHSSSNYYFTVRLWRQNWNNEDSYRLLLNRCKSKHTLLHEISRNQRKHVPVSFDHFHMIKSPFIAVKKFQDKNKAKTSRKKICGKILQRL